MVIIHVMYTVYVGIYHIQGTDSHKFLSRNHPVVYVHIYATPPHAPKVSREISGKEDAYGVPVLLVGVCGRAQAGACGGARRFEPKTPPKHARRRPLDC